MNLTCYDVIRNIGEGTFGKVKEVKEKATGIHYAMKKMDLSGLTGKDSINLT